MKNLFTLMILLIVLGLNAQNREKAFEINRKLGRGIKYGNMFEPPAEGEWGASSTYLQPGTGRCTAAQQNAGTGQMIHENNFK